MSIKELMISNLLLLGSISALDNTFFYGPYPAILKLKIEDELHIDMLLLFRSIEIFI